jgi:hypothetical protein
VQTADILDLSNKIHDYIQHCKSSLPSLYTKRMAVHAAYSPISVAIYGGRLISQPDTAPSRGEIEHIQDITVKHQRSKTIMTIFRITF